MNIMLDEGAVLPTRAEWLNCVCAVCGKRFHRKPSHIAGYRKNYCSRECHYKDKHEYMSGEKNHQFGLKGSANASWKSDVKESRHGYTQIRCLDHPFADSEGFVLEHRLVAEQYLLTSENSVEIDGKKYLRKDFVVHHINFDRKDNRPENLRVMTSREHQMLHARLNPHEQDKKTGRFVKMNPEIIRIKKVTSTAKIPEKKTSGAAGYDLFADIDEPVMIFPHETVVVYSGIAFEIPKNYFGAIYARSGIATRLGIRPATCVSVIDSDFRGNVGLPLHNDSEKTVVVQPGERVSQIVFQEVTPTELELADDLTETERGNGGFGSTGA